MATFETLACKEYARNVGAERPDLAWISTPLDSWERNPFYSGPPVQHPEDDSEEREAEYNIEAQDEMEARGGPVFRRIYPDDEIPF